MNEIGDFPIERGWVCPKCGRVMAPSQPYCLFCPLTTTTTTITDLNITPKSKWIYDKGATTNIDWPYNKKELKWWDERLEEVINSWKLDT